MRLENLLEYGSHKLKYYISILKRDECNPGHNSSTSNVRLFSLELHTD